MTPQERENYLTNRPPEIRDRILAKVSEYLALDPDERELRLRCDGIALVSAAAAARIAHQSRRAPGAGAGQSSRSGQKPARTMGRAAAAVAAGIFGQRTNAALFLARGLDKRSPAPGRARSTDRRAGTPCPEANRQAITAQFNQFFELTPDEKQKTLNTLSASERAQMEKTLQTFGKLPPAQRAQCIRAFTEFAGMIAAGTRGISEKRRALVAMTPKERQAWRDLVAQVPLWPPLPPAIIMPPKPPPLPPRLPVRVPSAVATN